MRKNSNTIKVAWIGTVGIVIASIITGTFSIIQKDTNEGKSPRTSITANDSSKVIVTNNQNDIKGDFVNGDKIVVNQKENKVIDSPKIDAPKALIVTQNQNGDNTLNVTQLSDSYATNNDGDYIKEISYPKTGEYGINILARDTNFHTPGTYSMAALIPKNQFVIVKISGPGGSWTFSAFQSIPGWKYFGDRVNDGSHTRKFKTVKFGTVDLELYLNGGDVNITLYENNSEIELWSKTLKIDKKVETN